MSSLLRVVLVASLCALGAACNRYELVPDYLTPACHNGPPPAHSGPRVDVTLAENVPPGTVTGRVVSGMTPSGLQNAVVMLRADFWKADTTDSLGRFAFSGLPVQHYEIVVRHIGFHPTRDSIALGAAAGVRVEAVLEAEVYDGACSGYAALPVRKPWWKLW